MISGFVDSEASVDVWIGAFGKYTVPLAISRLGRMAQARTGRPYNVMDTSREFWEEPYFRVVQEWGNWRDQQEREAYERERALTS